MEIFKISAFHFNRNDLKSSGFEKLANKTREVSSPPLYLDNGHCLMYLVCSLKHTEEKIREMTNEEKLKFLPNTVNHAKFQYREKDLKISVRNN